MSTSQSTSGPEKPQCVLVFLPGSMQMFLDQTLAVIAQQIAAACNWVGQTTAYSARSIEEIRLISEHKIQQCLIKCANDQGHQNRQTVGGNDDFGDIIVVSENYMPLLTHTLESSGYAMRFLRLIGLVCSSTPLLCRILKMTPRHEKRTPKKGPGVKVESAPDSEQERTDEQKDEAEHSSLTRGNKVLLGLAYCTIVIALFAAGATVLDLVKDLIPDLGLQLSFPALTPAVEIVKKVVPYGTLIIVCIVAFVPPARMRALLASGREYHGLVRYVLKSDRRNEIQEYLNQAFTRIRETYPSVPIHILSFSFGCIVCFDYLFAHNRANMPDVKAIKSVCFIGFPYAIADAGVPDYFANRQWPQDRIARWLNLYLADDALGSKIRGYLPQIFPSSGETARIPLQDLEVKPQRPVRTRWRNVIARHNPVARHLAYWDPDSTQPCEAMEKAVRSFLPEASSPALAAAKKIAL